MEHVPADAIELKRRIIGVFVDFRVGQRQHDVHRDRLACCQIDDVDVAEIDSISEQQNLENLALSVAKEARLADVLVAIGLDINA